MSPSGIRHQPADWASFVAIGDSFTEGLMDECGVDGRHRGWADRVADVLSARHDGFAYANLAIRGRLVSGVVGEQVPVAAAMHADLVSFAAGVNDTLRRTFDLNQTATAVEAGVRDLRASGADVVLFAFGDPSRRSSVMGVVRNRIAGYNQAVRAIAAHYGCYLVDFWNVAVFDEDRFWDEDRLHLSPRGHALAADAVLEALGLGGAHWRTPMPVYGRPVATRTIAHARWAASHLAPWVMRRVQGRSSGDVIEPKRSSLQPWPESRSSRAT